MCERVNPITGRKCKSMVRPPAPHRTHIDWPDEYNTVRNALAAGAITTWPEC